MDDFTPELHYTIDDAMDAGELLSFRYQNVLDIVRQA
jgi:hypothetical protein